MAKIFNEYFTQIASDIVYSDPIPDDYDTNDVLISLVRKYDRHPSVLSIKSSLLEHGTFEFKHVYTNQIFQILRNMNDKKATGYDGIPWKLLKIGAYTLAEMLCKLINISTSECRFPDKLKLAEISALLKKSTDYVKKTIDMWAYLLDCQKFLKVVILTSCLRILETCCQISYPDLGKDTATKLRYWEW